MASFAERMAAHKAASNSTPAAPVVATAAPVAPVAQPATKAEIIFRPEPVVATHDLTAVVATHDLTAVGINPPSGVPEGAPVMLGEFDPDRQSKGPFYQNEEGAWVALKGLKKPELKDAVKVLAARVRDAGLTATFEHNLTASTLDMKQIAADAKINVEGLRATAALLIRTLARDNEDELRRAGVDALPASVPEHRLTAVRIERAGGSRAEALVNLLKDGRSEEFVRLVNVSFEAPMSEDLLARTIAVVPQVKALPDVQACDEPDDVALNPDAEEVVAVVEPEPVVVAEPEAESFAERIKTLTNAARWAKHMNKDVMAHLVEINAKLNPPVAENALRAVVSDVCGVVVQNNLKADAAFQLVRDLKAQVESPNQQLVEIPMISKDIAADVNQHKERAEQLADVIEDLVEQFETKRAKVGGTAPIIAVGCEIAGPLLMQDFEAILTHEFEPKIAKKTGAQYGQAAYSEDYKLMAGLVEHYGKKQFDQHKNGVMTLNSFRRDRQYILDGLARAGWIILNGRG